MIYFADSSVCSLNRSDKWLKEVLKNKKSDLQNMTHYFPVIVDGRCAWQKWELQNNNMVSDLHQGRGYSTCQKDSENSFILKRCLG